MQNKINLDTHNELITVSEPWHRGSGFTWMLLALAGVVFFLTGAVAKSESISYTMQGNQFDRTSSTGNAGTFNDGATQFGMWMDGDNTSQGNVIWKTFRTGSSTGSSARDLQVGDSFTIKINTRGAYYGSIGVSLNDGNDFASDTFSNRLDNSRLAIIQNGGNFGSGGGRGSWFADGSGTSSFNITPNSTTQDYDLTFKITSGNTANVRVQGNGSDLTINDVALDGTSGANIDSFSVWLSDDRSLAWNDSGGGRGNVILKSASVANTGTVELGYALASGSKDISGVISDGLAAGSTTTTSANSVYVGGDAGSQVNLSGNNTYTGTTTVNANATAEVQHANALGSTSSGTTVTSGGALKLYNASGISFAAEDLTLNGVGVNSTGGALRSVGGDNTWNGAITAGSNTRIAATTGSLTVAGAVSAGSNVLYLGTAGGNITVSGAISGAGASQDGTTTSLFKDGSSTLTLSGNNTYSGDTRITAGALTVNSGGNLGNGNSDVYVSIGATLNVNTSLTVDSVQETGTGNGGVIALGNGATLTVDGENKGTLFQNSISGTGGITMAGSGDTSLSLYGTQSYTGATTVSGGKISSGTALASTSYTVSGGTMETSADSVIANNSAISISGTGNFSVGGNDTIGTVTATGGRLTVTDGKTAVLNGNSSIGSAAKIQGAGTIEVGTATANSGTLTLNSTDADNTSALSVASGGTLSGTFRTSGALSVDGVLAPGNSTGTSYAGNTTFLGGGNYEWEIDNFTGSAGSSWDFLSITGTLTISATSADRFLIDVISLLSASDLPGLASNFSDGTNYSFAIATASGGVSGWAADKFDINTSGFQNAFTGTWGTSVSGNSLNITYTAATAIPEPSSAALTLIGLGVLALRRRCG